MKSISRQRKVISKHNDTITRLREACSDPAGPLYGSDLVPLIAELIESCVGTADPNLSAATEYIRSTDWSEIAYNDKLENAFERVVAAAEQRRPEIPVPWIANPTIVDNG